MCKKYREFSCWLPCEKDVSFFFIYDSNEKKKRRRILSFSSLFFAYIFHSFAGNKTECIRVHGEIWKNASALVKASKSDLTETRKEIFFFPQVQIIISRARTANRTFPAFLWYSSRAPLLSQTFYRAPHKIISTCRNGTENWSFFSHSRCISIHCQTLRKPLKVNFISDWPRALSDLILILPLVTIFDENILNVYFRKPLWNNYNNCVLLLLT